MNEQENNPNDVPVIDTDSVVETGVEKVEATVEASDSVVEVVETKVEDVNEVVTDTVAEVKTESTTNFTLPTAAVMTAKLNDAKNFIIGRKYTIAAVILVVIALLAVVFLMEQQGRLNTGIFDGVQKMLSRNKAVALINDSKISQYDLNISMAQIATGAAAQGADIESEEVKNEIQTQAIDMLVNTELLKQEAAARGIEISADEVNARLETLKTDVGGEEVLKERMKEFNIDEKTLRRDIKNELTIQKLLEAVFVEKTVAVTEEEVLAFYETAGGPGAELPALEEVRAQIEAQIKTTKEQEVVTAYIEELRGKATIELLI
jgi:hypothetical protein